MIMKHRAKRKDKPTEWVFGNYLHDCNHHYIFNGMKTAVMCGEDTCLPATFYHSLIKIIPETLSQFIGLKDKQGKEIYGAIGERGGDIAKGYRHITEVCFGIFQSQMSGETGVGFYIRKADGKRKGDGFLEWPVSIFGDCEIIGTVADNPELLREK